MPDLSMVRRKVSRSRWCAFSRDLVSKGKFIRAKGRAAWESVPKFYIVKDGKRAYITREGYLDNVWLRD